MNANKNYDTNLFNVIICASPETLAHLVQDLVEAGNEPWNFLPNEEEIGSALDFIYKMGCDAIGSEEFAELCKKAQSRQDFQRHVPIFGKSRN